MGMNVDLDECPHVDPSLHIKIFHHATVFYHAPSEVSGIGGMKREIVRATPSWHGGPPRHDCVYVERDPELAGFRGLGVAQVRFFLSFWYEGVEYKCAFVRWFETYDTVPCDKTGLWRVRPDHGTNGARRRLESIIHVDTILRSAHLIPVYGKFTPRNRVPKDHHHSDTLEAYNMFYVNRYIDYHAHENIF